MGAFERVEALFGPAFGRISRARVAVFGVGGVGGWCAECLARTGVGHLTLVDFDRVEETNVNRQVMATSATVGLPKVKVFADRLREINPAISLDVVEGRYTAESAGEFDLASHDAVVDAIDSVADKADLVRHALSLPNVELFSSMGAALRFDPSKVKCTPFGEISGDALARALRHRLRRTGGIPERPFTAVWSDEPPAVSRVEGCLGSLMQVTAVMGLHLASSVIRALELRDGI